MFHSNTFMYTRGEKLGAPISEYLKKQESTNLREDINMDIHNRNVLKNYGPDRLLYAHEEPRRDNGSVEKLNIRHYGAIRPELPYRVDNEVDTQFYDSDPRGFTEEQNWQKMVEDSKPRAKLQLFGKDHDHSIVGEGISVRDMETRIIEMRRDLRGRLNWFEESLDNFITGHYGLHDTTDKAIMEDTSSLIDPSITDSTGRKNINRIMSDNLYTGGKYFTERTVPDHVLPVASYGFVFKSGTPMTPKERTALLSGEQPAKILTRENRNSIKTLLSGKSINPHDTTSDLRFHRLLETQNTGIQVNKDIMAILGITEQEIKFIKSLETVNKPVYNEFVDSIVKTLGVLEKLPANARFELRNKLLSMRTPEFKGGVCKSKCNIKIKNLLTNKNRNDPVFTPKQGQTIATNKIQQTRENNQKSAKFFEKKKDQIDLEKIDYNNLISLKNKQPAIQKGRVETMSEDYGGESISNIAKQLMDFSRPNLALDSQGDTNYGVEHVRNDTIKPRTVHRFFR